ncbi:Endonuclease III-like protein 1 [Grifola frondosa]|uniref:DNA-(apurinic or apyrimidinic site) lyase n=1 Tax=Grifola frondosa TaxID=5627 RepID=A0A1C7LT64_GRIFR|nr:Endonuclease III-like protein 1 [Grifola frondosa]
MIFSNSDVFIKTECICTSWVDSPSERIPRLHHPHESTDASSSGSALWPSKRVKVSSDADTSSSIKEAESASSTTPKAEHQSKARVVVTELLHIRNALDVPHPAPARWREAYDAIKEMRARTPAPIDTMGCQQAQLDEKDPKNQRFSTLVWLMLSLQTKDEVTNAAVIELREAVGGCLSVDAFLQASKYDIYDAIYKVRFWKRKTHYITLTAERLRDDFDSDVPKTVDELCSLPGVGPKIAFFTLQVAWKLNVGIGVDMHVHRITNRLGWHVPQTEMPEQTRCVRTC